MPNYSIMNDSFNETMDDYMSPEFRAILCSILVTRAKVGATIDEIREDYYNTIGEQFPNFNNITDYLLKLPNITCTNENGTRVFNIASEKSKHLITMKQKEKPPKQKKNNFIDNHRKNYYQNWSHNPRSAPIDNYHSDGDYNEDNCYFEDNYQFLEKINAGSCETLCSSNRNESPPNCRNSYGGYNNKYWNTKEESAHLYDHQLMGDDFFLSMAKMELRCKYRKDNGIHQSGLCISGQTITEADYRVRYLKKINSKLILNIGSVDILQGRHLVDIQYDFLQLLNSLESRGIRPILTTLAPLANHSHRPDIKRILERFNEFIRSLGLPFIDVWSSLANQNGSTLYGCYQSEARYVTGSSHPHVFWNKIGRQRVLNNIKSGLEY